MSSTHTDIEKGHVAHHDHEKSAVHHRDNTPNGVSSPPAQVYPRPSTLSNPGPLGLFSFASTTFILSMFNISVRGIPAPNAVVGMAIFCGGLAQLLAGMWEFPRGNTFASTAFTSYGAFWMSYATILIPSSGIIAAYPDTQSFENALGIYLSAWMMVTFFFFIVALRKSIAFIVLFGFLTFVDEYKSDMATHTLLNSLKANKTAFGVWLTLPGLFHARTVAQASPNISWICIDSEHGLVPLVPSAAETVASIHGAVDGTAGPSAIVRIPATGASDSTSWQIKYALDAGARGVIVPMVSTAEKAREVASDCRFPPIGRRGFGSPFTQGNWGLSTADYLTSANGSVVVMVQIETPEAVKNVKEIAAVDGIDVLFIGPYDLSISLGYPPPSPDPHPEVEKIIQQILYSAHDAGKKCAIFCISGSQSARRATEGFDIINVTSDTGAMSEGIARQLSSATA